MYRDPSYFPPSWAWATVGELGEQFTQPNGHYLHRIEVGKLFL